MSEKDGGEDLKTIGYFVDEERPILRIRREFVEYGLPGVQEERIAVFEDRKVAEHVAKVLNLSIGVTEKLKQEDWIV